MRALLAAGVVLLASASFAGPPAAFTTVTVAGGFVVPTAFAQAPDGRLFVAEKGGIVRVVDGPETLTFLDLSDDTNEYGDRGLLGIALDPQFGANGFVYLFHTTEPDPGMPDSGATAVVSVVRIRQSESDPNAADLGTLTTLLTGFVDHQFSHSGGCLRFDAQGRLLASFGDGSSYGNVDSHALATYDLDSLSGKIVRVDPATGAGVADNPYFDAMDPAAVRSKVLARGFRNPFRFGIDPATGDLWVGDVGWSNWEEVNRVPLLWTEPDRDLNYGWPCYEGATGAAAMQFGYASDPATEPTCLSLYLPAEGGTGIGAQGAVHAYAHGDPGGESGSSVTGGVFYQGGAYPAEFVGRYFFGDYARDRMQTLTTDGVVTDFGTPGDWGNPVDIQLASNGNVRYLAIGTGELREIQYAGANRPPVAVATGDVLDGPVPLRVRFDGRASTDPDGDRVRHAWDFGDGSRIRRGRRSRHRYSVPGTYIVTLTVSDRRTGGLIDSMQLTVNAGNTPPAIGFTSPANGAAYRVGDTLSIALTASDAEDGPLSGAQVQWRVLLHHLGHIHYLPLVDGTAGSFPVPDHGDDSFLSIEATATDALGGTAQASVTLTPETVPLTVTSAPEGLQVVVDGQSRTTPYAWASIIGGSHTLTAPSPQTLGAQSWAWASWSDGLGQSHAFVTPAAPLSLTATYAPN